MTDSENSQPLDDSDDDIYNNILEFNFEDELVKLEGSKETYKQEVNDLSEKVQALAEENKELKKSNEVLKKNLSTLLKTAQAEIRRKDSMIEELRNERNKNLTKDKYTSTDDLISNLGGKYESEKQKSVGDKKRSKSFENWTSSDSERKSNKEKKKKESFIEQEENLNCDKNNRKSDSCRGNSKMNSRHPDSCHGIYNDRHRERKSTRYEYSSGYRKPYRENHLDHLKYDSFDKKRHSRSSDRRFISCRRNSKEKKDDCNRSDSCNRSRSRSRSRRRRRRSSSENSKRFKSTEQKRSHSRDISRRSKESSHEKFKTRSSLDKNSVVRTKKQISIKMEISDEVKNNTDIVEYTKRIENSEKRTNKEDETTNDVKSKQIKEKNCLDKREKRSGLDTFSTKSPLDALYNDMITNRSFNHFSNSKSDAVLPESDLEEGEIIIPPTTNECQGPLISSTVPYDSESLLQEDWTLSFKNERKNETKSMTLYSKRMMQKFSTEKKIPESLENKEEKTLKEKSKIEIESKKVERLEVEKEPGELTDDESVIESSKEFQELTKVASIKSEIDEKMKEKTLKETIRIESLKMESLKIESVSKTSQKETEKLTSGKEESAAYNEIDSNKSEVVEFSPFKNNYKLIEISPIKPSEKEHILDFYNRRASLTQSLEQNSVTLSEEKMVSVKDSSKICEISEEKYSWKNSSSEKDSETELKIIIPLVNESPNKQEMKREKKEEEEFKKKKEKIEITKSKVSRKNISEKKERTPASMKKIEKLAAENKDRKRKRKLEEIQEESSKSKKRKREKNEPFRKSTRSKRNSKSETENNSNSEVEPATILEPEVELENKAKEDISSFEFFKPVAKIENPSVPIDVEKAVSTTTDYKMTAMMSVSGVVRLETPSKCLEKLNNLIINEQMIFNVLDSKNNSQFSPLTGSKYMEMTPRRMLKNDLMLTDSEDDSVNKRNVEVNKGETEQEEMEEEEEEEEEKNEMSGSENSECDSDSGASDFVDLL